MRRNISLSVLAAVSALTAVVSMSPSPAAAEVIQERYCLQGREYGYPGNCQFSSYSQCMASASGTPSYCGINPHYAYEEQRGGRYQSRY